jgi:hypothetical protein
MRRDRRLRALEANARVLDAAGQPCAVVVDRPEQGPQEPSERRAWLESRVPAGVTNVIYVRVVRS